MRNWAEMRCEALLSRHILTLENNVNTTDFLGGFNNFATLSQVLTNNSKDVILSHVHPRQDTASFAECKRSRSVFMYIQQSLNPIMI